MRSRGPSGRDRARREPDSSQGGTPFGVCHSWRDGRLEAPDGSRCRGNPHGRVVHPVGSGEGGGAGSGYRGSRRVERSATRVPGPAVRNRPRSVGAASRGGGFGPEHAQCGAVARSSAEPTARRQSSGAVLSEMRGRPDGAPHTVSSAAVERVLTTTLETMPRGATQWSTHSMTKACGMSSATVNRIWQAFGLQPPRIETFKLSTE